MVETHFAGIHKLKARQNLTGFFDRLLESYAEAAQHAGEVVRRVIIAGERIEQRFASPVLSARFAHALAHLPNHFDGAPDLTVYLWDGSARGGMLPPLPWRYFPDLYTNDYGSQGEIAGFNDARFSLNHVQWFQEITMIDRERKIALFHCADALALPYWYTAFPLRSTLHMASRDRPLQLMHAAAVGTSEGGVLLIGNSGAGKSTTALACLLAESGAHGLQIAGDDYVAVGLDNGGGQPTVHSLYSLVKLVNHPQMDFPVLAPFVVNPDRPAEEKAMIALHQAAPDRLIRSFALRAIIMPCITGQTESRLVPGKAIDALRVLAPSTIYQTVAAKPITFRKLAGLVRSVPVYTLLAGTDIAVIPGVIARFLRENKKEAV